MQRAQTPPRVASIDGRVVNLGDVDVFDGSLEGEEGRRMKTGENACTVSARCTSRRAPTPAKTARGIDEDHNAIKKRTAWPSSLR